MVSLEQRITDVESVSMPLCIRQLLTDVNNARLLAEQNLLKSIQCKHSTKRRSGMLNDPTVPWTCMDCGVVIPHQSI